MQTKLHFFFKIFLLQWSFSLTLEVKIFYILVAKVYFFYSAQFFKMHSLISIVGVVLTGKYNYPKWLWKIKQTLFFNELWKGVCVGDGDKKLEQPTSDKEFSIWENKKRKGYAFIIASISEDVSHHISPFSNALKALEKMKELYDSHNT